MSSEKRGLRRFRNADDPREDALAQLEASQMVARQGDVDEATRLLRSAVEIDPGCAEAWQQLAWLSQDPQEREAILRRVLELEPDRAHVQAELGRLQAARPSSAPSEGALSAPSGERRAILVQRLALGTLVLVAAFFLVVLLVWGPVDRSRAWLLSTPTPTATPTPTLTPGEKAAQFVPQLEAALTREEWGRALEILDILFSVDPLGAETQQWALAAFMQYGRALVRDGEMESALAQFDEAVALAQRGTRAAADARLWQQVTQTYLSGREALAAEDWPAAIEILIQAQELMPEYADVGELVIEAYRRQGQAAMDAEDWTQAIQSFALARDRAPEDSALVYLLSTAYRQRGIAWQEAEKLQKARTDLESALALRPNDAEAQAHYDDVMYILFPPKRIEINLSTQRFYAWQGDTLVYSFLTSTGEPGRGTKAGKFEVLDKIPMAYSSIWRLKMPYWLGIYYVGSVENGIHALPIRPDGSVMWGGLLGQRASYGCVILSTEAARLIYHWAEIGTPVEIHY